MPAKSKQQQKFFGVVKSMQKGDIPKKGEAGEVADDMTKKEIDKMASTKHKGLPKKIKEMIEEELQALNEVQPFVDNKLRNKYDYPKGNRDGLVYLATNDKRYPTEIVIYNQKRDVFHFVYSHSGEFKPGSTSQQTVPRQGFNSTHYVMPYFEEWEEDLGYERGFYEAKLPDEGFSDPDQMREAKDPTEKDLSIINKARAAAALKQIKSGKRDDGMGKFTDRLFGVTPSGQVQQITDPKDISMYKKFGLAEAKMTPAKVQKAQKELVATIQLLKKNFPMYKAAKDSGDEKKLAKHRDIALKLTKKKKELELNLDKALGGLYQDAELDLKEGKVKQVTKQMWDKMDDDARVNALLTAIEDPDDAESHFETEYDNLPDVALANMVVYERKLNEMDINDPVLVAMRAFKTQLKKDKLKPKPKKISMNKYYKLMDMESDLIDQMKDAAKELAQLNSDMNAEAGQKGDNWSDADANRYGGDLDKLQSKYEKLVKQKAKVKKAIMDHRIS